MNDYTTQSTDTTEIATLLSAAEAEADLVDKEACALEARLRELIDRRHVLHGGIGRSGAIRVLRERLDKARRFEADRRLPCCRLIRGTTPFDKCTEYAVLRLTPKFAFLRRLDLMGNEVRVERKTGASPYSGTVHPDDRHILAHPGVGVNPHHPEDTLA